MPVGPRPAPPVGTARVAISGTCNSAPWANVFYLDLTHTADVAVDDLSAIADEIESLWLANVAPAISKDVTLLNVDVRFFPAVGEELRYTGSYSAVGTGGNPCSNASTCAVIDFVISAYYRGGHPRLYQVGIQDPALVNSVFIEASNMTQLVTAWNAIRNGLNAFTTTNVTGISMGTVSFESAGVWRDPPIFRAYTSVKAGKSNHIGSQRRRIVATAP